MVKSQICGVEKNYSISEHIKFEHKMNSKDYKELYPDFKVKSDDFLKKMSENTKKRWLNPDYREKQIKIRNITHKDPEYKKRLSDKIKQKHKDNPEIYTGFTGYHTTDKFKLWVRSEDRIKKISETSKKRWKNEEYRNKTIETLKKVLNDGRCAKDEQFRIKMSEKISELYSKGLIKNEKNKYKTGIFESKDGDKLIYASSYELESMELFEAYECVTKWTNKHGIRIDYYFNNLNRKYVPDFFIELIDGSTYIIELKGWKTDEVLVKEHYAKKVYQNYKLFYSVNDLKNFLNEKCKN